MTYKELIQELKSINDKLELLYNAVQNENIEQENKQTNEHVN